MRDWSTAAPTKTTPRSPSWAAQYSKRLLDKIEGELQGTPSLTHR